MCKHTDKTRNSQRISKEYEPGLVSVIIPTYNRADLVGWAIQSVLDQTYKNFEIIVVDDGSMDNTQEEVQSSTDPRIRYIKHQENKGGSAARNTGIRASNGEYVAFLDCDCQWLPKKIERQLKIFDGSSAKLGAITTGTIHMKGVTEVRSVVRQGEFGDIYKQLLSGEDASGTVWTPGGTPTVMVKRECFDVAGLFDELMESLQDHELYIRIAKHYDFDVIREPLVKIKTDTPDGISSNMNAALMGKKRLLEKYSKDIPRKCLLRCNYNFVIGKILCSQGRMKEARKHLLRAIASRPNSLRNWIYWIHFLLSILPVQIYKHLYVLKSKLWG